MLQGYTVIFLNFTDSFHDFMTDSKLGIGNLYVKYQILTYFGDVISLLSCFYYFI